MPNQSFDPTGITEAVTGITGLIQAGIGLIGAGKANRKLDQLFKQRKAFQTPAEVYDILNMTQNNAQAGFDPQSLDYLTTGADRGLASSLGTAERLGADPNAIGGVLDNYFQDIFKIGGENDLLKMNKFDKVINATQVLADNKTAEQISQDNLIKDQMAAEAHKLTAANQNIQSGLNLDLNTLGAIGTKNMYNNRISTGNTTGAAPTATTSQPGTFNANDLEGLSPTAQMKLRQLIASGILN